MSNNTPTRTLLEVALGFFGALLILPLLFKLLGGVFKGLFRFRTTRKLMGEAAVAGLVAVLTNDAMLDHVFGKKGGDGLLKASARDGES